MSRFLRTRSLFWTFAGAFLAVLIIATLLQIFVVGAVLRPITERWMSAHAALLARRAAADIAALPSGSGDEGIEGVLRSYGHEMGGMTLLFRGDDGRVLSGRRLPPGMTQFLTDRPVEEWEQLDDAARERHPGPWRPAREGESGQERRRDRFRPRLLVREPVQGGSGATGEVIALGLYPPRGWSPFPRDIPRPLLLYLPLAILLAGAAGLIMVRILLRRLRSLEDLAARVTDGDLEARVQNPGGDEIGRLGERMNVMTASLAEARARIEESDRQRKQLLADISHELATPLTSIRGYTETLLEPAVSKSNDERTAFLQNILEESKRMDLLIQDLFDLTRLESGATGIDKVPLDWAELCRNTVDRFRPRLEKAGLRMRRAGLDKPVRVLADGRRLEQVLENLLVNALRYVPPGGTVTVSMDRTVAGARLTVSDDGPGFPDADLPHIFDRFYRADAARTSPGSGLGLAIVKEIVRRHGGEAMAENRKPHGAAIVVELPAVN